MVDKTLTKKLFSKEKEMCVFWYHFQVEQKISDDRKTVRREFELVEKVMPPCVADGKYLSCKRNKLCYNKTCVNVVIKF